MSNKESDQLIWIPLFISRLLTSPRWKSMKDFQRGWYIQILLLCAESNRPGYLPLTERLWVLAGAHRREMWENHKSAVMACFKTASFDGSDWIYNERMLHTIENCFELLSHSLEKKRERAKSISKSMKGNGNAKKQMKTDPCIYKGFSKPSLKEIQNYCIERNNSVNAEAFLDHYEANGWKVGRTAMKDWRAAVRTWEKSDFGANGNGANRKEVEPDLSEHANPECFTCSGTGSRASYSTPGKREACECTQMGAGWRDRTVGEDDSLGTEGVEEPWFEESEGVSCRALGASANGRGTGKV